MDNLLCCTETAEKKVASLQADVDRLVEAECDRLEVENKKLATQLQHLETAAKNAQATLGRCSPNVLDSIRQLFCVSAQRSFGDRFPRDFKVIVAPVLKSDVADYHCTSAMQLAGAMKKAGVSPAPSPKEVAQLLADNLPAQYIELFQKPFITGPGFVQFKLQPDFVTGVVSAFASCRTATGDGIVLLPPPPQERTLRAVIDYSSPNIAKEMHVGHLRSTIIGDTIARLYEYVGHSVLRVNHVGDWGTQFGMLIAHLRSTYPEFLTKPPPISDLQAFYRASKQRFDEDEVFKRTAYDAVVQLQSGNDEEARKAWQLICSISRREFDKVYDRLDVRNLEERGESFYQKRMETLIEELKRDSKLEKDEEGRFILWPEDSVRQSDKALPPLIMVKSDGGFTYDTSDMATIRQRLFEEKGDVLLYVVDNGQSTHFDLIFSAARRLGWYDPSQTRVQHVGFGVVLGEDKKKFKTRSGQSVRLADLLDEGLKRATDRLVKTGRVNELNEREREAVCRSVAYGCVKFADLACCRTSDYVFSFDRMLEDRGKTAVYLLYSNTRIRSIARNAGVSVEDVLSKGKIRLTHEKEMKLGKTLTRFGEVVQRSLNEAMPHFLCDFVYEMTTAFSEFYENCYCVEKDAKAGKTIIHYDRLLLCIATTNVIQSCFHLLGIKPIEKM